MKLKLPLNFIDVSTEVTKVNGALLQVLSEGLGLKIPYSKISKLSPKRFFKNFSTKYSCRR